MGGGTRAISNGDGVKRGYFLARLSSDLSSRLLFSSSPAHTRSIIMRLPKINWGSKYLFGSGVGTTIWLVFGSWIVLNTVVQDPPAVKEAQLKRWQKLEAERQKERERVMEAMAERVLAEENRKNATTSYDGYRAPPPEALAQQDTDGAEGRSNR